MGLYYLFAFKTAKNINGYKNLIIFDTDIINRQQQLTANHYCCFKIN